MMPDNDYPHPLGLHVTENREREAGASFAAPPLLACPFCGGKAKARQPYAPKDIWKIGCDALGCDVNPEVSGIYERCIKAWNRRRLTQTSAITPTAGVARKTDERISNNF